MNDQRASDSYDANGNTIASGGLNYAYDLENRLVLSCPICSRTESYDSNLA